MSCTLEYNYFFTYMVEKIYLRDKNQATNFWDYVKRHKPPLCVGLDQGWPHFLQGGHKSASQKIGGHKIMFKKGLAGKT